MTDISSLDPQALAQQLASYDILAMQNVLKNQTATLTAQKAALEALRTALSDFRNVVSALNKNGGALVQNTATLSQEGIATVTTTTGAQKGVYDINVQHLATAHQIGFSDITDEKIKNASGELTITVGQGQNAHSITVNMDEINSVSELAEAINGSEDNPGVTVSLVRTDGDTTLMFSSDETGVKNSISIDASGLDSQSGPLFNNAEEISAASDAEFALGNKSFTSSTNTLDHVIDGVTITLQGTTQADKPLHITIGTDMDATQKQMQSFVDAFNTLRDTLNKITAGGNNAGDGRGAYAGDATLSSLDRQLNDILRTVVGNNRITDFGLTADKDGNLQIDTNKFEQQLKADPQSLANLFNGDEGLFKKMDIALDSYLNSSSGLLKGRQETLDRQQSEIETRTEAMNVRYDAAYNRYLKQFTLLQQTIAQMNNTMGMFGVM